MCSRCPGAGTVGPVLQGAAAIAAIEQGQSPAAAHSAAAAVAAAAVIAAADAAAAAAAADAAAAGPCEMG